MISVLDTGLTENWNGLWFVLSLSVAVLSSYFSFRLAGKKGRMWRGGKRGRLVAAGLVLGTGTWLVHLMSLDSYHRRISLHYDPWVAASAFVVVSLSAYIMLLLFVKQQPVTSRLAGATFGFGVTLMSALGVLSLRPGIVVGVDPTVGLFSIAIIFISAYFALYVLGNFRRSIGFALSLPVAALILGAGIFATQHVVLGALRVDGMRSPAAALGYTGLPSSYFVTGASVLVAVILAITWTFMVFERRMLKQLAFLDPLTGLRNRYALAEESDRRMTEERLGSMVLINLDRFKVINDTLGRDLGVQLLTHAAQRIRTQIQEREALFRMDGDEFLLVGAEKDPELLLHRVSSMLQEIGQPYMIEGNELYVTASAGISLYPAHGQDRSSLLKAADAALYQVVGQG